MGLVQFRLGRRATLLPFALILAGAAASEPAAQAEPALRGPTVVSGSGTSSGGLFTASASGAVFELPSHARLRVAPNSVLRVFPVPQALELAPGPRTTTWSCALMRGRVDVEMPNVEHTAVLANMGKLFAVVTKGRAALLMDGNDATVANTEGETRTILSGHWQTVPVGSTATLSQDNPSASAKPGVASPTLRPGPRLFFAPKDAASPHGFRWNPVPNATSYELRLRRVADGKVVDQRSTTRSEWPGDLAAVEPGKYTLALRAVDARGLEGSWSADAELRVIGEILPPGSYTDGQAVYLGLGQHVQFTHTNGLEMTYVGAERYFPAANKAMLYRNATTVIAFRVPGQTEVATTRLEPREIYAEVRIAPKRAIWPRDPISIDIRLKSRSGQPVPSFLRVVPRVTLGLETIDPGFESQGDTLHAVVQPSLKPGPWVLRVDVADQFGVPLGHEFLEVAHEPRPRAPAVRILSAPGELPHARPARVSRGAGAKMANSD